ncbi:hypothetical protein QYM36_020114 [Artemia franciscana]|uniref:N-acetylgalactosaminide beta-1,3-galactosyltransferase n=1 Tax=Artemia franciscana TaxID=6661 RepID=A0AA88KSQ9_ARTSF|nr:hypothetical protein QYM36_020114 [Artemia franciscana]
MSIMEFSFDFFFSSESSEDFSDSQLLQYPTLPTIVLPVPDDWPNLWGKTKEAFKYVYEHYFDKADWFFKADDDTFAIPENARDLLLLYDTNEPIYFGAKMKNIQNTYYAPGGAATKAHADGSHQPDDDYGTGQKPKVNKNMVS